MENTITIKPNPNNIHNIISILDFYENSNDKFILEDQTECSLEIYVPNDYPMYTNEQLALLKYSGKSVVTVFGCEKLFVIETAGGVVDLLEEYDNHLEYEKQVNVPIENRVKSVLEYLEQNRTDVNEYVNITGDIVSIFDENDEYKIIPSADLQEEYNQYVESYVDSLIDDNMPDMFKPFFDEGRTKMIEAIKEEWLNEHSRMSSDNKLEEVRILDEHLFTIIKK